MALISTQIIAPDTAHWAQWIDSARSKERTTRDQARRFLNELLNRGRIPLLSWHHIEELICIGNESVALERIEFIQSLPFVAWLSPFDGVNSPGSIADILTGELIAAIDGNSDPTSVRSHALNLMLRTGAGKAALGLNAANWHFIRTHLLERRQHSNLIAALAPLNFFDEKRTIGEISKWKFRSAAERVNKFNTIRNRVRDELLASTGCTQQEAETMADNFIAPAYAIHLPGGTSVRDFIVSKLAAQGVDPDEVRDECVLADLNRLAIYRNQLRVVAPKTGRTFEQLKHISMEILPSRIIKHALETHRQVRQKRTGSDVTDNYLAALAAYSDFLYVDKRTAEDFRRAISKNPSMAGIIGKIQKAKHFTDLAFET
ncbi:hypothetical protein [Ferrovibrio sp.]|uniref:hypothetical protein n=1 Tax=Ferrovibrio sp. TaxID=1917215 RepID=UPI003D273379